MAIYLNSLSSMVHFSFNHVKELELSHNSAKRKSKLGEDFFYSDLEGPVKLIQQVKIVAHSFFKSVSNLFHFIILSLPMYFYIWLSKNFSKPISKHRDSMDDWRSKTSDK